MDVPPALRAFKSIMLCLARACATMRSRIQLPSRCFSSAIPVTVQCPCASLWPTGAFVEASCARAAFVCGIVRIRLGACRCLRAHVQGARHPTTRGTRGRGKPPPEQTHAQRGKRAERGGQTQRRRDGPRPPEKGPAQRETTAKADPDAEEEPDGEGTRQHPDPHPARHFKL